MSKLNDDYEAHKRAVENYLDGLEDVQPRNYCPSLTEAWFKVMGSRATLRAHFEEKAPLTLGSKVHDTSAGEP